MSDRCGAWSAGLLTLGSIVLAVAAVFAIGYIGDGQRNPRGGQRW